MNDFLTMEYSISIEMLILVTLFTMICASIAIKAASNQLKKIFFTLIYISYYVYSGIGISIMNDGGLYLSYYVIYTIVFTFFLKYTEGKTIRPRFTEKNLMQFMERYGNFIIYFYFALSLVGLIFPENKLMLLFSPPIMDRSLIDDMLRGIEVITPLQSIVRLISNILAPFFYFCLFKYRYKYISLFILLFLPLYFSYCSTAYVSRTQILMNLIFYIAIILYYNTKHRKAIIIGCCFFFITLIPLMAAFVELRQGRGEVDLNSFTDSIDGLFRIEGTFPLWFEDIYKNALSETYSWNYILYIVFQPIPGFLKHPLIGNFQVNYSIGELLLNMDILDEDFFVPLSGIIGESVFIFGHYFFFLHAIICAYIINLSSNFFKGFQPFSIIFLFVICYSGLVFGRAGTTGGSFYPFLIKAVFYINLVLYFSKRTKLYKK